MSPGIYPVLDTFVASHLETPSPMAERDKSAREHLILKIALSTLPLIGLTAGVVSMAIWMIH